MDFADVCLDSYRSFSVCIGELRVR